MSVRPTPGTDAVPLLARGPELVERLTGIRRSRTTLYRWFDEGVDGVRLEAVSVGTTLTVTPTQLLDFFQRLDAAREKARKTRATARARRRNKRRREARARGASA